MDPGRFCSRLSGNILASHHIKSADFMPAKAHENMAFFLPQAGGIPDVLNHTAPCICIAAGTIDARGIHTRGNQVVHQQEVTVCLCRHGDHDVFRSLCGQFTKYFPCALPEQTMAGSRAT
jgi:hypothetical protein